MIRLSALRLFGKLIEQWCYRLALPVLITAWSLRQEETPTCWLAPPTVAFALAFLKYLLAKEGETENTKAPKKQTLQSAPKERILSPPSTTPSRLPELPTEVLATICGFLHPRDVTSLGCLSSSKQPFANRNAIWKQLWYRDYGNVLLQWPVGRQVLAESLCLQASQSLEEGLSQRLNALPSLKNFYFVFGEIYTDYLLARRNHADECYLGLHGHLLEFTAFADYHPGLADVEEVLLECGQDATAYFEQLPHSSGARAMARQLIVVVNQGIITSMGDDDKWGLALREPPQNLHQLLRISNSRPVAIRDSSTDPIEAARLRQLLPRKPRSPRRRPPTLARIRTEWDAQLKEQRRKLQQSFWRKKTSWRVYYDPLRQEWIQWDAAVAKED